MTTFEALLKRRSIRQFKEKEVEEEKIKKLLEAAMAAPSAKNGQSWEFYVVSNKSKIQQIKDYAPQYNHNCDKIIIVGFNKNSETYNDFAEQDCAAAIENILVECVELELGCVWCGAYPKEDRANALASIIESHEGFVPVGCLQIGYPDEEKEARTQYSEDKVFYVK